MLIRGKQRKKQTSKTQQPSFAPSSVNQSFLAQTKPEAFNNGKTKIGALGNTKLSKGNTVTQMTLVAGCLRNSRAPAVEQFA